VAADGTLKQSRAVYLDTIGVPPDSPDLPHAPKDLPATLDDAITLAADRNPNVIAAEYSVKAAKAGIDLVAGELLPTLALVADASRADNETTAKSYANTYQARLNLTVPIYEGGAVYSRLRAQKQTFGQRRLELDQTKRDSVQLVTSAWEQVLSAKARSESYEIQIAASIAALRGVEEEAKVGSRSVLDVLNAEQDLFDARVNLVRAQHDEVVFSYQVKDAVGQLTAEALNLPVERYDAAANYEAVRDKWLGTDIDTEEK